MTKLLIVESPSKVKKIKGYIGDGWKVEASLGHIRDLPQNDLGIALNNNFAPIYEVLRGKESQVRRLLKAVKETAAVFRATYPDHDGGTHAWHLPDVRRLPQNNAGE